VTLAASDESEPSPPDLHAKGERARVAPRHQARRGLHRRAVQRLRREPRELRYAPGGAREHALLRWPCACERGSAGSAHAAPTKKEQAPRWLTSITVMA
jgi:hypothetical protein